MKHLLRGLLCALLIVCMAVPACAEGLRFHFAGQEEGRSLITSCTTYYEQLSPKALAYFMQKKNGTVEEYISWSADQVTEFSDSARDYITSYYSTLTDRLAERGLRLPDCGEITIVATTGEEVAGATGYTHGTTVYLNADQVSMLLFFGQTDTVDHLLAHELFHCLTRNDPDFRAAMYAIIGFTINDSEFDIPQALFDQMITNPDVERHDAFATFTINGEKKDCYLLFMTDDEFENPGDSFFSGMYTELVTVDGTESFRADDADDFWDVVGRNTTYVEDPEECMAENFSFAILYGTDGQFGLGYQSPEIIQAVLDVLSK